MFHALTHGSAHRVGRKLAAVALSTSALFGGAATLGAPAAHAAAGVGTARCTGPTAVYGIGADNNLHWYGATNAGSSAASWASGAGNTVGAGWNGQTVFSGGDGVVYTVRADGTLWWYHHDGALNGTFSWTNGGVQIGDGWGGFTKVFSGGKGVIYAIDGSGNLHWYRHTGYLSGSRAWAGGAGNVIGTGWGGFTKVFSGGNGVIYAVDGSGNLHWYRDTNPAGGTASWAAGAGNTIGAGWGDLSQVFSAGDGVIYGVGSDTNLHWYRHTDPIGGSWAWASGAGNTVGWSWSGLSQPFADVQGCSSIADYAYSQVGHGACGPGYLNSCNEPWCADFAMWAWQQAGVNLSGLDAGAGSFYRYGQSKGTLSSTPHVGDAVVFGWNYDGTNWDARHVAIVTSVNADGTITSVGGNENGVVGIDTYPSTVGNWPSGAPNGPISGYVSPLGD
ncbi:tachylectin-related carbohydrate-binding protein [Kitasatospora sp. NPDC002227]|uniref:tachylectin-related carbohydrate-binding protein n=1 Tax=Kitasatospora sp. NPDC002227 TaxID=3154773 RepID=UPI00332E102F